MYYALWKALTKEISLKIWIKKSESYLSNIKTILLSKKPKNEILDQLAKEQESIEDFAHRVNTTENNTKSGTLVFKTILLFFPLLVLLLPRTEQIKPLNLTLILVFSISKLAQLKWKFTKNC